MDPSPQKPARQFFKFNVCRLCSLLRDKVLPIFDNAGGKVHLKIMECFPNLNIKKDDSKPQYICIDCITKLNMFNEFLHACVESECKFDNYIKQYLEQENVLNATLMHNNVNERDTDLCSPNSQYSDNLPNNEKLIFLSKLDSDCRETTDQDLVLLVELRYKADSEAYEKKIRESKNEQSSHLDTDSTSHQIHDITDNMNFLDYNIVLQGKNSNYNISKNDKEGSSIGYPNVLSKDRENYKCAICGRCFGRKSRLNSHIARHSLVRPFKCDKCDKAFATRWDLTTHSRLHSDAFSCSLCGKRFISKSKLGRHLKVHSGEKPFNCLECGKSFGEKSNLESHSRIHSGIKPFSCTICNKSFGVKSHLKDHQSTHNGKLHTFKCSFCSKAFKWKTNYNRHLKSHTDMDKATGAGS